MWSAARVTAFPVASITSDRCSFRPVSYHPGCEPHRNANPGGDHRDPRPVAIHSRSEKTLRVFLRLLDRLLVFGALLVAPAGAPLLDDVVPRIEIGATGHDLGVLIRNEIAGRGSGLGGGFRVDTVGRVGNRDLRHLLVELLRPFSLPRFAGIVEVVLAEERVHQRAAIGGALVVELVA